MGPWYSSRLVCRFFGVVTSYRGVKMYIGTYAYETGYRGVPHFYGTMDLFGNNLGVFGPCGFETSIVTFIASCNLFGFVYDDTTGVGLFGLFWGVKCGQLVEGVLVVATNGGIGFLQRNFGAHGNSYQT